VFDRILLIRLSALGDVVLATPALRALRLHAPRARIDWLVDAAYAPVLDGNPHLSSLVPYDKGGEHRGAPGLLRLRNQLRRQRYDLVIDLQAKPKTLALARSVGAQRVVTLEKRTSAEALRAAVGFDRPVVHLHAVDMYLRALEALGVPAQGPALDCAPSSRGLAQAAALRGGAPYVGLAPGARWATKRWPPERFAAVANHLAREGHRILLVGGPGDRAELAAVRSHLAQPAPDTAELGVDGLIAAVAQCELLVCGDSGPLHLACALGVPTVGLYGPTSPRRWAPRGPGHRVIDEALVCSPCSNHGTRKCPIGTHACMQAITEAKVLKAARELLADPCTRSAAGPA